MTDETKETLEQPPESNPNEDRARRMGWVPAEDFRGDPHKWVDADEFVKRGEDIMPILKERNRVLDGQLSAMQSELADMKATFKQFGEYHKQQIAAQYERALKDLKKQQLAAVEIGDVVAYQRAENEIGQVLDQAAKLQPQQVQPQPQQSDPMNDPVFKSWLAENQWYGKHVEASGYANMAGDVLKNQGLTGKALLDAVAAEVKSKFPALVPKPKAAPAVEGDVPSQGGGKGGKSYRDLPAAEKAACDRFVAKGIMTREQYVKDYDWD